MWSYFVNAIKGESKPIDMAPGPHSVPRSAFEVITGNNPRLKSPCLGVHREHNLRISRRIALGDATITLQGWPSRGGVIVLENATPPDFDFLHLDPLDPPLRRDEDQDAEDAFCRALLRLGATWWDSEAWHTFIRKLECGEEEACEEAHADDSLRPTRLERGWVRVAWPSHTPGALCVLACEKVIMGKAPGAKLRPRYWGLLSLARTMDERCIVMQRLGGAMYASIDDVQAPTFLKAWEENHQGERGLLVKQEFMDPVTSYGGHPDDALGKFSASMLST